MLSEDQDAYGKAIYAYFQGDEPLEIIERDDGFIGAFPGIENYFQEFIDWPIYQKEAMRYAHGRVLDVGCGAGRVSLYLQNQGFEAVGIDNSPLALDVCRERGLRHTSPTPITQVSAARLGIFDTIIMLGNNFGLFGNYKRAKWLLKRFHKMTSERGRMIVESNDIYQTDNPEHLDYHQRNLERGRMAGQVKLRVRYGKTATPWFDYLMVSKDEMADIIMDTGWWIHLIIDPDEKDGARSTYIAVLEKGENVR